MHQSLNHKTFLIAGVANKKSIAYFVAREIQSAGGQLILTVANQEQMEKVAQLFPDCPVYLCNVEDSTSIEALGNLLKGMDQKLDGFLHSIAFADYSKGIQPFHEISWPQFSQASKISCFSFAEMVGAFKDQFNSGASIVTMGISNTRATSYGMMGPIKSALESSVAFLAKGLSSLNKDIRVNAVCAGPLKTTASAGIPGYIPNYLFAEKLTLRKRALETQEVANTVLFLLSSLSSGINAASLTVDAGMSCNYFDEEVVAKATT
jgi:enoyl-[acyl-carrier protein] reductase I